MRKYLTAECSKAFHRFYFFMAMLVTPLGVGVLVFTFWLSYHWGNGGMTFQNTAQMVALILSVGLYATLLTGDIVFSDQYKNNTLKNEVSYGVPRVRIYLGKLIVAILVAIVACVLLLGTYVGLCWILFPHGEADGAVMQILAYCLAGAFPLWLGAQGVVMACYFLINSNTAAAFASVGILAAVPTVFQVLGLTLHPVFEMIRQFMPQFMVENLRNMLFDWSYVGLCWLVGLAWLAVSTLVGLLLFSKKEIR